MSEKLLLIIAYQLSGMKTARGERICPSCKLIGGHHQDCELGKMEKWLSQELMAMWKEATE